MQILIVMDLSLAVICDTLNRQKKVSLVVSTRVEMLTGSDGGGACNAIN